MTYRISALLSEEAYQIYVKKKKGKRSNYLSRVLIASENFTKRARFDHAKILSQNLEIEELRIEHSKMEEELFFSRKELTMVKNELERWGYSHILGSK